MPRGWRGYLPDDSDLLAEFARERKHEKAERESRERDGLLWPPDMSDDDPYGDDDHEYHRDLD